MKSSYEILIKTFFLTNQGSASFFKLRLGKILNLLANIFGVYLSQNVLLVKIFKCRVKKIRR